MVVYTVLTGSVSRDFRPLFSFIHHGVNLRGAHHTAKSDSAVCISYCGVNCSNFLGVKNTQYLKNSMVYITLQRQISAVCITQSISTVYITMWSQVISVVLNHTAESNCAPWSQNQKCCLPMVDFLGPPSERGNISVIKEKIRSIKC